MNSKQRRKLNRLLKPATDFARGKLNLLGIQLRPNETAVARYTLRKHLLHSDHHTPVKPHDKRKSRIRLFKSPQ